MTAAPTTSDTVLYDLSDGVATVTLNRPDAMNALNTELKTALRDTLLAAADDPDVRAVLLTVRRTSVSPWPGTILRRHDGRRSSR